MGVVFSMISIFLAFIYSKICGSKTDSGKRKRDTGSSSTIKEKKRKAKKKKNKNTEGKPFVDAEGNSNTAKHMSTIDDMVRGIENFVRQMNE